jgi:type I restriction enzyme S subunit
MTQSLNGWNISREVALVPVQNVNAHFYAFVIASQYSQHWLTEVTKGVAYQGINLSDLRLLPVPCPDLEEQHEIVLRVEKLFFLADSLETKYKAAMSRVEKIEQSVLAVAFRGELVEPDPSDEPAEELLERIKKEREKESKRGESRK